jgi:hypothetical protein
MGPKGNRLQCHFSLRPFPLSPATGEPTMSIPCRTRYHVGCFRLTKPFLSRLSAEKGLSLPKGFEEMVPTFICECCTVRAVLQRELNHHHKDTILMMLERMRIIDMAHNWAPGTINTYKGKLNMIKRFENTFGCQILRQPTLVRPPSNESIPLMWTQQHYSLQQRKWKRSTALITPEEDRVSFTTVRALRSAAALYHTWLHMVEKPGQLIREKDTQRPMQVEGCSPTDGLDYSLMTTGMSRRLGESSTPSIALLGRHVQWMNAYFEKLYKNATDPRRRQEIALAALCNCIAWLAWLRGGETFGLCWKDATLLLPGKGEQQNLESRIGAVKLRLLEQTKTCRSSVADVALAFCSGSGIPLGKWFLRARYGSLTPGQPLDAPDLWTTDARPIFCHPNGKAWDSNYYRTTYLLPLLQMQRLEGDPYLQFYDGSPGRTLAEAFYSMHSYRIGARSHVSQKREGCKRKATADEVNEHGRWEHRRSSENMAEQYRQWELAERLALTLLCM